MSWVEGLGDILQIYLHKTCGHGWHANIWLYGLINVRLDLHYATHDHDDTRLTHGHRKLRLAEEFETLRLTPDFEILRLTLILKSGVRCNISKSCVFCDLPPVPSCCQVNWNAKKILDVLSNTIWLFLHAGTGLPIQTIWLFLHVGTRPPILTTWFLYQNLWTFRGSKKL